MKRASGTFLVCDGCGYCCYMQGNMAATLSVEPPACPGCGSQTRLAKRPPWRERLERAS